MRPSEPGPPLDHAAPFIAAVTLSGLKGTERSRTLIASNTAFEIAEGTTAAAGSPDQHRTVGVYIGRILKSEPLAERERVIALEPHGEGLLDTTLRYPYECATPGLFRRPAGAGTRPRRARARRHMAVRWTWVFDTPYRWTKQMPA